MRWSTVRIGRGYGLTVLLLAGCVAPTAEHIGEAADAAEPCDCSSLPVTPCSRPACDEGTCYLAHTPDGEPADADQPHGDCATAVCVGLAVVQAYEPHDRPTLPDGCLTSLCTPFGPVWLERDGCLP